MAAIEIDEAAMTKGQARKLAARRKSIGDEIADRTFLEWLSSQPAAALGLNRFRTVWRPLEHS